MRGSHSFAIDLSGARIEQRQLIGQDGDYYRQPWFSGGAIRFCAAQLGGAAALLDLARDELTARGIGRAIPCNGGESESCPVRSRPDSRCSIPLRSLADRSQFGGGP